MQGNHQPEPAGNVRQIRPGPSPAEIVRGLCDGDRAAGSALYQLYGKLINRLVWRLLGADSEHDDVVHQVFVNVLSSIGKIKDPEALESWITGVTINTVRKELRRRKTRRIVFLVDEYPVDLEPRTAAGDPGLTRGFYQVLNGMSPDERIVFGLRFVEGYTLAEIASLGHYSLATAKRKLRRARTVFIKRARRDPALAARLAELDDG